jgi:hypothetical protein
LRRTYEYEHAFIQHVANPSTPDLPIPLDVAAGLTAWGADGWEVVHMEGAWAWHQDAEGKSWPETLRGYYVTFKREAEARDASRVATATAERLLEETVPAPSS